jgi:hypothetical protein
LGAHARSKALPVPSKLQRYESPSRQNAASGSQVSFAHRPATQRSPCSQASLASTLRPSLAQVSTASAEREHRTLPGLHTQGLQPGTEPSIEQDWPLAQALTIKPSPLTEQVLTDAASLEQAVVPCEQASRTQAPPLQW